MSSELDLGKFHGGLVSRTKVIYVAGPFIGDSPWQTHQNVRIAEDKSAILWHDLGEGVLVITPHLNSGNMIGVSDERTYINGYLKAVDISDCVYVLPNWEYSKGTKGEIVRAFENHTPVFFDTERVRWWFKGGDDHMEKVGEKDHFCHCCSTPIAPENRVRNFYTYYLFYGLCKKCMQFIYKDARYQPKELGELINE